MYILGFVIVLILIWIIVIFNKMIKNRKKALQSESGIDVYLQQRFDLIPNLIEVVKEYKNYEKDMLEKITELRSEFKKTKDMETAKQLIQEYNSIIAVIENYPDLKASEQFLKLQKNLIKVESQLQAARRIYNNDVTTYNTQISSFPNNIIAKIFKFEEMNLFELEEDNDNISINFWKIYEVVYLFLLKNYIYITYL